MRSSRFFYLEQNPPTPHTVPVKKSTLWILTGVGVVVIAGGTWYAVAQSRTPGPLDGFAQCLKEKKVTFYGAFWCPHCQNQKKLFGKSAKYLPYVECSTADSQKQLPVCKDKKIEGYPTWEFADGSRESRELTLQDLAGRSGCTLPAGSG